MNEADERYWLLSETSGIEETRSEEWQRHFAATEGFEWLKAGWRDLRTQPVPSIAYGIGVFLVSVVIVWLLAYLGVDYILFPALAGFMIVAPVLAIGIYEKSRALDEGRPLTLAGMILVRPKAGAQAFFTGLLLCMLMLLWMRAAVLIYALFFGLRPFPGLDHVAGMLFGTPVGWAMLLVGTAVGGLFAAFAFSISAFSVPMLLDRRTDALTAMATSMALVWNNLVPMVVWGAIVLVLFAGSVLTGLVGLVVVFPLLGHATWHAYRAVVPRPAEGPELDR